MSNETATKARLAAVLRGRGLDEMAAKAEQGYYDDFESPLVTPIMQLVIDLTVAGHPDLAQKAKDGEFDGTLEESIAWFEREGKELLR